MSPGSDATAWLYMAPSTPLSGKGAQRRLSNLSCHRPRLTFPSWIVGHPPCLRSFKSFLFCVVANPDVLGWLSNTPLWNLIILSDHLSSLPFPSLLPQHPSATSGPLHSLFFPFDILMSPSPTTVCAPPVLGTLPD